MKLVGSLLESIEGIQIFYIVGLLLFFGLFIVILIRTLRRPKEEMNDIKESILVDDNTTEANSISQL